MSISPAKAQGNSKTGEALIALPLKGAQYARTSYTLSCRESGMLHLEVKMLDENLGASIEAHIINASGEQVKNLSQGAANAKENYVREIDLSSLPDGRYVLQIGPSAKPVSISFLKGNRTLQIN